MTCLTGFHKCNGVCVADDGVDHCGASCTACPLGIEGSERSCTRAGPTSPYVCGSTCPLGTNTCPSTGTANVCAPADYTLACGPSCSVCTGPPGQRGVCASNGLCTSDCITRCGGVCVSTQTSNLHCGACGVPCLASEQCTQGECRSSCTSGVAFKTMLQTTTLATADGTLAVADFDGDGRQDAATSEGSTLRVRLGQSINGAATGTFGAVAFSSTFNITRLLVGDLTGDGRPELVALGTGTTVAVYRYVGGAGLFATFSFATSLVPTAGAIAELNGAAPADLLLTFSTALASQSAAIFTGNGAASGNPLSTVANPANLGVSNISAVQVGQLTADALPDLALATGSSTVYLMPGTGMLATPFDSAAAVAVPLPAGETFGTAPLELFDVLGNAVPELVVPVQGPTLGTRVFPLTAGPVVGTSVLLPSPSAVRALGTGDVDADGRRDLVVMASDVRVYKNGGASFSAPQVLAGDMAASTGLYRLAVVDAFGDARADLVMRVLGSLMVVPNEGGVFPALEGFPVPTGSQLATGDLNGDGRSDVAVVTSDADAGLAIVYSTPAGGWTAGPVLPGDGHAVPVIAQLNQDGFDDLVTLTQVATDVRLAPNGRLEVYMNGAWGTVCDDLFDLNDATVACRQLRRGSAVSVFTAGGGAGSIWLDDLACTGAEAALQSCARASLHDCSHSEDVGVVCSSTVPAGGAGAPRLEVRFGSATTLSAPTLLATGPGVRAVESADLDNDGLLDLLVLNDQRLEWHRNLGSGSFAPAASLSPTTTGALDLPLVADVNNDGLRDVALPDGVASNLRWWMNTTAGGLLRLPVTTSAQLARPAFAVDVSDDGKVDLVGPGGVYTGDGTGALVFVSAPPVPITARVLVDLDNDGRLDLGGTATATPWLSLSRGAPVSTLFSATAENYWAGVPLVDVAKARLNADASRDLVALIGSPGARVLVSLPGVCR